MNRSTYRIDLYKEIHKQFPVNGGLMKRTLLSGFIMMLCTVLYGQASDPSEIVYGGKSFPLYPETLDSRPPVPSPFKAEDGTETVTVFLKDGRYALILVTVENGDPLLYSRRVGTTFGKDHQLHIDSGDFPELARTGLHSESHLDERKMITGYPVDVITYIGRPGRFSYSGFLAEDEDIISVLKGDNRLVGRLGLTHPGLARPLFHVWNMILKEIEIGRWARFYENVPSFFYHDQKILLKAEGTKGWQVSIFQDEIQGRFDISVQRTLSVEEMSFLKEHYSRLDGRQFEQLEQTLSVIHFSEMLPYYIMRYGFYEGHTDYRSDPLAIAFVFGLKTLEAIEATFPGRLYEVLTDHFTTETVK